MPDWLDDLLTAWAVFRQLRKMPYGGDITIVPLTDGAPKPGGAA